MTITRPRTPALLRGGDRLELTERGVRPHRLPGWVAAQSPDPQLLGMESQPSGVRVAVLTSAETVELVLHPTRLAYRGLERPRGNVDLLVDGALVATDPLTGGDGLCCKNREA